MLLSGPRIKTDLAVQWFISSLDGWNNSREVCLLPQNGITPSTVSRLGANRVSWVEHKYKNHGTWACITAL
jgi:hypothetical protein